MTVMAAHQPTKALASFAADLDPAALQPEVRQKLGWLLLDYLRVCSIGARLPWSDWARGYIGLVGKEGASHVLFSASTLNPQHATFMNVTFGSSFDADDTHVGAMLHPGVAVGRPRWRRLSTSLNPARSCWLRSWRVTRPSSGSASRFSPAISGAVSRAPEPVTCSGPLRPRRGSSSAAAMPAGESKKPSDWRAAIPAASHNSTIPAPPENAFRPRTRPRAVSRPPC